MSLIHQALKKVEGSRTHDARVRYAFKNPGVRALRRYALPLVFIISAVSAYLLFAPAKKNETAKPPVAAVKAPPVPEASSQAPAIDFNAKGMDEFRAGRFKEAEGLFRKALEAGPLSESVHNNLGLTLMKLGKKDEAEVNFKKALEIRPGYPEALNNYACLLAESGKSKKALPLLERAIKADPAYGDARFNLAVLLEKKGDLQGALSSYEEFIRTEPAATEAAQVRKKLMVLRSELILKQAGGR